MTKTSAKLPEILQLNAIDRSFLVPETEDIHGSYFPIAVLSVVTLYQPLTHDDILKALYELERWLPQLRLGYVLDIDRLVWRRVPDDQLATHFEMMISTSPEPEADLEALLPQLVNANIEPFELPIAIILHQNMLILKFNHSFSDGMLGARILNSLLIALYNPQSLAELPPLQNIEGLPMLAAVKQQPNYWRDLLAGWVKTVRDFAPSNKPDLHSQKHNPDRQPILNGSPMRVKLYRIAPETITHLKKLRSQYSRQSRSISMNTLLQVMIAHRLHEMGYLDQQVNYTIPVDLHRYLDNPTEYFPGNVSSQIRVTVTDQALSDILTQCETVQTSVDQQLEARVPLYVPTLDWLLRLVGRKRYNKMNSDWYHDSINSDPRLFIFSNLGEQTRSFRQFDDFIDFSAGMFAIPPLLGGPPLMMVFNIIKGQGNLSITYDPQLFTAANIDELLTLFDAEWLAQHLELQEKVHALDY